MTSRSMPWLVALTASLFVLLVESRVGSASNAAFSWVWRVALLVVVLGFTHLVFARIRELEREHQGQAERCQVLFEQSTVGIAMFRSDCRLVEANDALVALTGWSRSDLVGQKACSELLLSAESGVMGCAAICPSYRRAGEEQAPPVRLLLQRRGGTSLPVMASTAPVALSKEEQGFALFLWDMSEQETAEREALQRRRQAEGLVAIGREIAAAPDRLEPILDRARDLFHMDLVAWGTLDEATQGLTWEAATGAGAYGLRGAQVPVADTPLGRALQEGRPYISMEFAREHASYPAIHGLISRPPLRTTLAVPFRVRDQSQGVLLCASRERLSLTDEEVKLFAHLGGYLATAVENAGLLAQVQELATLQERQRLAAEMHDGIGQLLTYLGLRLHAIDRMAGKGDTGAIHQEVESLKAVLQEAHTEVRTAIFRLKESAAFRSPLSVRWKNLLDDFVTRTGILVDYRLEESALDRLSEAKEAHLTRILQEVLVNVRNHSGAYSVQVRAEQVGPDLVLTVTDDGCGFDPARVEGVGQHHFGLTLMRERAEGIGGRWEVRSRRGHGTTVSVRCPVDADWGRDRA